MKEVESYNGHPNAQAVAIHREILESDMKIDTIVASLQSLPGHEELTSQLTKGSYVLRSIVV